MILGFAVLGAMVILAVLFAWDVPRCSKCGRKGFLVKSDPYLCLVCAK